MSYEYAQKRRGISAPGNESGGGFHVPERSFPNSARLDALKSGAMRPTAADKGHRLELREAMRAKMEQSFGADLSNVKMYESQAVADAGAEAVTQGNEIAFAPGKTDFSSASGQALLGHELSHVVSQSRGEVTGGGFLSDSGLEARADREGAMAARGETIYSGEMNGGAFAPLSTASAAPMAGPMQAKKAERAPSEGRENAIRKSLEDKSSVSLSDVDVHYNSPKPAEIGALAYAQGTDVYMGPGQEEHLGHELTHVVQQKQGLVRPTGSVDGMPANTSPALEGAADQMRVSSAPEAASVPASGAGGVVQGIFVDKNGKKLSKKDVDAMVDMMSGSLESHSSEAQSHYAKNKEKSNPANALINDLKTSYSNSKKTMKSRYMSMFNDDQVHSPEEVLGDEVFSAQRNAGANEDRLYEASNYNNLFAMRFLQSGNPDVDAGNANMPTNKSSSYDATAGGFKFSEQAAEGVQNIQDFDPEHNKAETLTEARMGNSSTLKNTEDPKAIKKAKKGFTDAAEVSRKGAVAMRKSKEDVSFGSLYGLLSGINKTVRKSDPKGGKLRGQHVSAGNILGVGSGKAGEFAFKALSDIAAKMNEVKKVKDKDLQKTQAIELANYANAMLISEHLFEDGNGRTCRLFADSILQTFGLPPHTPVKETMGTSGTMGEQFDFKKGSDLMLQSVQSSSNALQAANAQNAERKPGFLSKIGGFFKNLFGSKKKSAQLQPA